MTFSLKIVN